MMEKLFKSKNKGWSNGVSPKIRLKFKGLIIDKLIWKVLLNKLNQLETRSHSEAFKVDLERKTCS